MHPRPQPPRQEAPVTNPFCVIPTWAFSSGLKTTDIAVLVAISATIGNSWTAQISQAEIAALLGIARQTVNYSIKRLRKAGVVVVRDMEGPDKAKLASTYFIPMQPGQNMPEDERRTA